MEELIYNYHLYVLCK